MNSPKEASLLPLAGRLILHHARIITPKGVLPDGWLVALNGRIACVGSGTLPVIWQPPSSEAAADDAVSMPVDAQGMYLSPGFIDLHTHGAGGHDFMDASPEAFLGAAATHAAHGTTLLLPTSLASTPGELDAVLEAFTRATVEARRGECAQHGNPTGSAVRANRTTGAWMPGLHLEGPYFSKNQRGAQDPRHIRNPDPDEYEAILAKCPHLLRWSAAPELPGALAFGRRLKQCGILPSIGHSDATEDEVAEAFKNGFTHVTHLYSCMSGITRVNGYRKAGIVESAYLNEEMTVEIIADGAHLPASLLKLVLKVKGPGRIALVTDSMRAAGMPEGPSVLGSLGCGQPVLVENGVAMLPDRSAFAGSVATAERLVRNMVVLAGASLTDAVRMMTETPATIIGLEKETGTIEVGKRADLTLFDDDFRVFRTIVAGETVWCQSY